MTTTNPFEAIERTIALSSRDWSKTRGDAALYGIVCGWDNDDGQPRNSAMDDVAAKVGWGPEDVEQIRELRRAWLEAKGLHKRVDDALVAATAVAAESGSQLVADVSAAVVRLIRKNIEG